MAATYRARIRRPAIGVFRSVLGRLRTPRAVVEGRERLVTPEELRRLSGAGTKVGT